VILYIFTSFKNKHAMVFLARGASAAAAAREHSLKLINKTLAVEGLILYLLETVILLLIKNKISKCQTRYCTFYCNSVKYYQFCYQYFFRFCKIVSGLFAQYLHNFLSLNSVFSDFDIHKLQNFLVRNKLRIFDFEKC